MAHHSDILNHPLISARYFFPRRAALPGATVVEVDGAALACWRSAPPSSRPVLVHFHGNGELVHDWMGDFARFVERQGFDLFLAEYRGYGASSGAPELGRMLDDIPMIAKAAGCSPNETVVFGRSVGSIFALEWARRFPQTRALVIESGIHDVFERLALRIAPNELNLDDLEAAIASRVNHGSVLSDFPGPSLFLHAEHDQLVSIAHAERNAAAAGGRAELVRLPHGGHNSILWENASEYLSKLGAFLSLEV